MTEHPLSSLIASWRVLAMAAIGVIGIAVARDLGSAQVTLVAIGTALLAVAVFHSVDTEPRSAQALVLAGVVVLAVFSTTALPRVSEIYVGTWAGGARLGIGILALAGVLVPSLRNGRRQTLIGILIIWMVVLLGGLAVVANPDSGVDVQHAHEEASRLLFAGRNPYSDLVITDTSPTEVNEGTIVGYSYPPVSMVVYAVAERLGDSRFANVALIGGLLAMVLVRAGRTAPYGLLLVGVLASLPFLGGMVIAGWTEPLQAALMVAAALLYRRWLLSSVVLGLAIASKQYMLIAAVPLMVMGGEDRLRRLSVVVATAAATFLPFFLWNPVAMWDALVGHQLGRLARSDVASLWALGIEIPMVIGVVTAATVGIVVSRRARGSESILGAQAVTLAVFFLLTPNSFLNFWFLVVAMVVGWLAIGSAEGVRARRTFDDAVPLERGAAIHGQ